MLYFLQAQAFALIFLAFMTLLWITNYLRPPTDWFKVTTGLLGTAILGWHTYGLWKMSKGPYQSFPNGADKGFLIAEDGFGIALVDGEAVHRLEGRWTPWSDFSTMREEGGVVAVKTDWKTVPIPEPLQEVFRSFVSKNERPREDVASLAVSS